MVCKSNNSEERIRREENAVMPFRLFHLINFCHWAELKAIDSKSFSQHNAALADIDFYVADNLIS